MHYHQISPLQTVLELLGNLPGSASITLLPTPAVQVLGWQASSPISCLELTMHLGRGHHLSTALSTCHNQSDFMAVFWQHGMAHADLLCNH